MIPHAIREGFAGFKRARFSSVASTSAITVALVLVGLFIVMSWQASTVSSWLRQRVGEVELFLEDGGESSARSLQQRAINLPGVDDAIYISAEEARTIFREEFGEGADVFFDETFLPASIRVRVTAEYANPESLAVMVAEFETWNRVDEVVFNQPLLIKVQNNLRLITLLGSALGILVAFASVFLVANTIRLAIFARRLLIRTMKLVGATDAFIRQPFLVEGAIQGAVAWIVALPLLLAMYSMMRTYVPQMTSAGLDLALVFGVGLLALGVGLGWLGARTAVGRFLKNVSLH